MDDQDQTELRVKLAMLEIEHGDLAKAIDALEKTGADVICIQRFKKRKLDAKDKIARLKNHTTPNIIA